MKATKVLQIVHGLPLGGAENQVVSLATALHGERYKLQVCCLRQEGVQADTLRGKGIPVVSLHMSLRYWPLAVWRLYRIIREFEPDVVHTHLYEAGIWGRLTARLAGVPVIVTTEHGMTLWKKRYHVLLEQFVNRFTDKVIAVSDDIRQRRIQSEGVPAGLIVTVPNGVAIERFRRQDCRQESRAQLGVEPSAPVIGTVARLVAAKRLDQLLQAAKLVSESAPRARFLIAGDGPLREELSIQARQLGLLPEHVSFLGSRQDIPEILAALDIFVLSSEREGLPVCILEAMAAGRPVIATRVGGIPQVIEDGSNGVLVPPNDPPALARAILALIEDAEARKTIAQNGARTVEDRFSISSASQQIAALYDNLLMSKTGRQNTRPMEAGGLAKRS